MRRFPAFRLPADFVGVFQPDGGFLRAEPAIEAQLALARDAGAELRIGEDGASRSSRAATACAW